MPNPPDVQPPEYRFCPFCAAPLSLRPEEDKLRHYCAACNWTHYPRAAQSIAALILRDGQVLLVRRAREPFKGSWMLPAGFLDYAEHPAAALLREVREETGLAVTRSTLLGLFQSEDDPRVPGHNIYAFLADTAPGEIRTDPEENTAIAWFPVNRLPEIAWKLHRFLLAELQRNGLSNLTATPLVYTL